MKDKAILKALLPALTLALGLGLLSGCSVYHSIAEYIGSSSENFCPDAMVLVGASVLPAFDPAQGPDPTSVVYTASISSAVLDCSYRKKSNAANSGIAIKFHAVRPEGGIKAVYRVPYFIALTTNGRVLDKKQYWQELTFPQGVSVIDAETEVDSIKLKPARRRLPNNYHYVVGFQLTQVQYDYVVKSGRYEQ
jgi:hypothetical protein